MESAFGKLLGGSRRPRHFLASWPEMLRLQKDGAVMCCCASGMHSPSDWQGIYNSHAYAILLVKEVNDGSGNTLQMLKLRNPHGKTEWTGRYSDRDTRRWTARLKREMRHDPHKSGNDGVFCMLFEDFKAYLDFVGTSK